MEWIELSPCRIIVDFSRTKCSFSRIMFQHPWLVFHVTCHHLRGYQPSKSISATIFPRLTLFMSTQCWRWVCLTKNKKNKLIEAIHTLVIPWMKYYDVFSTAQVTFSLNVKYYFTKLLGKPPPDGTDRSLGPPPRSIA